MCREAGMDQSYFLKLWKGRKALGEAKLAKISPVLEKYGYDPEEVAKEATVPAKSPVVEKKVSPSAMPVRKIGQSAIEYAEIKNAWKKKYGKENIIQ